MATQQESIERLTSLHNEFLKMRDKAIQLELISRQVGEQHFSPLGPVGNVVLCLEGIYEEAFQSQGQSASDADESIWTDGELVEFVAVVTVGNVLVNNLLGGLE